MKLGIGLPTWCGNLVTASDVLEWARLAEDAGFHALSVHDKPRHDTWEPLTLLASLATVTSRVRLVVASIPLPTRDEALVAKQAVVIDRVSGGRLELGVTVGGRPDDFDLFGRPFAGRGRTFDRQLARLIELFGESLATRETGSGLGPAPVQQPHPPVWVGGYADAAIARAVRHGHGYLFGAPGLDAVRARIPDVRQAAAAAGRTDLRIGALAYVLPSEDPDELAEGERLLVRYYGPLAKPFTERVHTGSVERVREVIRGYEAAGVDVLHLLPVARGIGPLERLAAGVLPAFSR